MEVNWCERGMEHYLLIRKHLRRIRRCSNQGWPWQGSGCHVACIPGTDLPQTRPDPTPDTISHPQTFPTHFALILLSEKSCTTNHSEPEEGRESCDSLYDGEFNYHIPLLQLTKCFRLKSRVSCWTSSKSEDLYDGKVCVICYDDPREYLFIPCGHCIACHACTIRIMKQGSKSFPICIGMIDKMRKLAAK